MAQSYLFMSLTKKLFGNELPTFKRLATLHYLLLQHVATQGFYFIREQPGPTKTISKKSHRADGRALRHYQ
jgi:hypothetical protein